ncbi:putative repeat protein (TIGR01451 family) [Deinobacterium chartae]|uniref:Putative repeat protein (TIGR01451 family) n=1 Tax=Deinobacterium chartae TaxID=521158 RepID=A0A841I043_9DEIO|nr:isopeptide-forming domain-containing fimbrial protein [Deinobacterium chartae]MBB6097820.1 putative repeat protein (TIGR01451 family) [Deinobacterium chartae]
MRRWLSLLLVLCFAVWTVSEAQQVRPFAARYNTNDRGGIFATGNVSLTCADSTACRTSRDNPSGANSKNNNDFTMVYVDVDSDSSTWNSSSATLSLPTGTTVLWAGLYWGARDASNSSGSRTSVRMATPTSGYVTVNAQGTDTYGSTDYQSFADVTNLIRSGGNGSYTVANVRANSRATNLYAGWGLVVVYRDPAQTKLRNLVVFDGYNNIQSGTYSTADIQVNGFTTPLEGPVSAEMGVIAYEGDFGLTGDQMLIRSGKSASFTNVSDALNPTSNVFNSTVSYLGRHLTDRSPAYVNNLGFDLDTFDVSSKLQNGDTSATLRLTTSSDQYFPGVVTFAVDLHEPDVKVIKGVIDVNGGAVAAGDTLRYTIRVRNEGLATAEDVVLSDAVPNRTTYVPGTLRVDGVAYTDAAGDDPASFQNNTVTVHLGTSASAAQGGRLAPSEETTVTFDVRINTNTAAGSNITNRAELSYLTPYDGNKVMVSTGSRSVTITVGEAINYVLSGKVFEDVNYGGGQGRSYLEASGAAPLPGARVELYNSSGALLASTTTNSTGDYFFSRPAGSYTIRVVNDSVTSSRPGGRTPNLLPVQTFRYDPFDVPVRDEVGGRVPSGQDSPANTGGANLSSLTAQSLTAVTLTSTDVVNLDFGFNFDTIVNTQDSGQGSLRQFIINANALGNTGLAQAGQTPGREVSIFMLPAGRAVPGIRASVPSALSQGYATIAPLSALPALTDPKTSIDGTTQTRNVGNDNPAVLGAGGAVGTQGSALPTVPAPEILILGTRSGGTGLPVGLSLEGADLAVRGIAIYGFGNVTNTGGHANIVIGSAAHGALLEQNVIGSGPASFADPGSAARTMGDNVSVAGADSGIARNNLVGFAAGKGFNLKGGSDGWLIRSNEIRGNTIGNPSLDGIDIETGSKNSTVELNLIVAQEGPGVDSYQSGGGNTIQDNTIVSNGRGTGSSLEAMGVRLYGPNNVVRRNIIRDNAGAGVLVVPGSTGNRISQNAFGGNGGNAIDLGAAGSDEQTGDGITVNDGGAGNLCGRVSGAGNAGLDYPVFTSSDAEPGGTTVRGTACPGAQVELYRAAAGAGDTLGRTSYGEGVTYLATVTADASGNFVATLSGVNIGDTLSALAIDSSNNTSEFSANFTPGYTLSGVVYRDTQPNGQREPGENGTGLNLYAKLLRGTSVVAVVPVNPVTGVYTFDGLGASGAHTVVIDDNAATTDTTPSVAGWVFVVPESGSRSVQVGTSGDSADFGLFQGSRLRGNVFFDDGRNGGSSIGANANNALRDGSEPGVAGATVTASSGSSNVTAVSNGLGDYVLYLPAGFGPTVTLSVTGYPGTGSNLGTAATVQRATGYGAASRQITGSAGSETTVHFGVVETTLLAPNQTGTASSPGTVLFDHLFTPGTLGRVTLSVQGSAAYQIFLDADCDGQVQPSEQQPLTAFEVDASWPRNADGSLATCALQLRVILPAALADGSTDTAQLSATLTFSGNAAVKASSGVTDVTRVGTHTLGALSLEKSVQNLTDTRLNTSATQVSGKQNDVLEYTIRYRNRSSQMLRKVVLSDPVPFFTVLLPNAYGPNGEAVLVCPDGSSRNLDLGSVTEVSLPLTVCGGDGSLSPGAGGEFRYRVHIQ